MEAGKLRNKFTLQTSTESRDVVGGVTQTWANTATVWGSIKQTQGVETNDSERITQVATHEVKIRYYSSLTPTHRLLFGSRIFSIISINDLNERNRTMVLMCKEEL